MRIDVLDTIDREPRIKVQPGAALLSDDCRVLRLRHFTLGVGLVAALGACKATKKQRACEHALTRLHDMADADDAISRALAPPDMRTEVGKSTDRIKDKYDANFVDLCVAIEDDMNFSCILDIDRIADHYVARHEHELDCEVDPENCGSGPPGDLEGIVVPTMVARRFRCTLLINELQERSMDPSLPSLME